MVRTIWREVRLEGQVLLAMLDATIRALNSRGFLSLNLLDSHEEREKIGGIDSLSGIKLLFGGPLLVVMSYREHESLSHDLLFKI